MSLLCLIKISAKSVIKRTLQIFEDWIENVAGEVVKSKQICYRSLQEVIEVALAVFPVYLHQPGRCDLTRCRTWFQFLRDVCYFLSRKLHDWIQCKEEGNSNFSFEITLILIWLLWLLKVRSLGNLEWLWKKFWMHIFTVKFACKELKKISVIIRK